MLSKSSGFTLIELMVVISIIGILSVIGLVSFQGILQNSKDSTRQADLKRIQSALQEYFSDQGFYPLSDSLTAGSAFTFTMQTGNIKTYMNKIPGDPKAGNAPYKYMSFKDTTSNISCDNTVTKCITYCLYSALENTISSKFESTFCEGNKPAGYNFAVSPP